MQVTPREACGFESWQAIYPARVELQDEQSVDRVDLSVPIHIGARPTPKGS